MPALRITRPISAPPREVVRRLGNHFEEHEFVHLDEVDEHGFSLVLRPSATEPAMIATAVVRDEGTGSLLVIEHRGSHVSCLKVSAQILVATIMLAGCMLPEAPRGSLLLALGILGVSWQGSRRARQDRATREFMAIVGAVDDQPSGRSLHYFDAASGRPHTVLPRRTCTGAAARHHPAMPSLRTRG